MDEVGADEDGDHGEPSAARVEVATAPAAQARATSLPRRSRHRRRLRRPGPARRPPPLRRAVGPGGGTDGGTVMLIGSPGGVMPRRGRRAGCPGCRGWRGRRRRRRRRRRGGAWRVLDDDVADAGGRRARRGRRRCRGSGPRRRPGPPATRRRAGASLLALRALALADHLGAVGRGRNGSRPLKDIARETGCSARRAGARTGPPPSASEALANWRAAGCTRRPDDLGSMAIGREGVADLGTSRSRDPRRPCSRGR